MINHENDIPLAPLQASALPGLHSAFSCFFKWWGMKYHCSEKEREEKHYTSRKKWLWESKWKGYQKTEEWKRLWKESETVQITGGQSEKKGRGVSVCIWWWTDVTVSAQSTASGREEEHVFGFSLLDSKVPVFVSVSSVFSAAAVLCSLYSQVWTVGLVRAFHFFKKIIFIK